MKDRGLVKTRRFKDPKYVGDPINAVRIFNDKYVDEIMFVDIAATAAASEPNYKLISHLAIECRMPLCYGGGITTAEQFERIVGLGVEKVAISSAAIQTPKLINEASQRVGSQSVVVVLDIKKSTLLGQFHLVTHNATRVVKCDPIAFIREAADRGAGEIVINNVDRDGMGNGYDLHFARLAASATNIPITVLGGAGSLDHVASLWAQQGIIGAAAGSLFVFKGKYRAVLINYPSKAVKESLIKKSMATIGANASRIDE